MVTRSFLELAQTSPATALVSLFILWKILIVAIAVASPGLGYDTSSSLLFSEQLSGTHPSILLIDTPSKLPNVFKFARWDVIYFASIAQRGYLFEQEWAFGTGHTKSLAAFAKCQSSFVRRNFDEPWLTVC